MISFKYNVDARNNEGKSNTWVIVPNIDHPEEKLFTDHIEFLVDVTTNEKMGKLSELGFCMVCEGKITYKDFPSGDKQFVVIVEDK